jgi:hypothetical protein
MKSRARNFANGAATSSQNAGMRGNWEIGQKPNLNSEIRNFKLDSLGLHPSYLICPR